MSAGNSNYTIPFTFNDVSIDEIKKFPKIYITAGDTVFAKLDDTDQTKPQYTVTPKKLYTGNSPKIKDSSDGVFIFPLSEDTPQITWSAIVHYLVDMHESNESIGKGLSDGKYYYSRWFGETKVSPGVNTAEIDSKNYSGILNSYVTAINTNVAHNITSLFGTTKNSTVIDYFTDNKPDVSNMPGVVYVGIKSFRIYAECDSSTVNPPEKMTVKFNNKNSSGQGETVTVTADDWLWCAGINGAKSYWYTDIKHTYSLDIKRYYIFTDNNLFLKARKTYNSYFDETVYNSFYYRRNAFNEKEYIGLNAINNFDMNLILQKDEQLRLLVLVLNNYSCTYSYVDSSKSISSYQNYPDTYPVFGLSSSYYDRFFKDCSIGAWKDSSFYEHYKIYTESEEKPESKDMFIAVPYGISGESKSGVHMFGRVITISNVITATIDTYDDQDLKRLKFYIGDVVLSYSNEDSSWSARIVGHIVNINDSDDSDDRSLTDDKVLHDIDDINKIDTGQREITVPDISIGSTLLSYTKNNKTVTGYNNNILTGGINYVANAVMFTKDQTGLKLEYVEGSLTIDGFSPDDINGSINTTMDSGSHIITAVVQNKTGFTVLLYPQVFNMIGAGDFRDAFGRSGCMHTEADVYTDGLDYYDYYSQQYCPIQLQTAVYDFQSEDKLDWHKQTYLMRIDSRDILSGRFAPYSRSNEFDTTWLDNFFAKAKINTAYDMADSSYIVNGIVDTGNDDNQNPIINISNGDSVGNSRKFYKVTSDASIKISIMITANPSPKAAVFAIGVNAMIETAGDYTNVVPKSYVFNESYLNKIPAFIQLGSTSEESSESKYITVSENDGENENDKNIVNIGEEISSADNTEGVVFDSRTFKIKMLPKMIVNTPNKGTDDYDKIYDAYGINGMCLTENDLVFRTGDISVKWKDENGDEKVSEIDTYNPETKFKYLISNDTTSLMSDGWVQMSDAGKTSEEEG